MLSAEVSTYPFTTKKPNIGKAYVQTICVCRELGVSDKPRNSACMDGWRFIPIELVDLPGLIKGSYMGKGLGTQFLSVAATADALLNIVDASGSVDVDGKLTRPGMGNPVIDTYDIEEELVHWFIRIIEHSLRKAAKPSMQGKPNERALYESLGGLKITLRHVQRALQASNLQDKPVSEWKGQDIREFAKKIREISKPTIIIANKMDIAHAERNYERLAEEFGEAFVVPCSSEAELALRRAEQKGYIKYIPGEETFRVIEAGKLSKEQTQALNYVQQRVFSKWIRTGVQFAVNTCVFKLLNMNTVYPVEDEARLSDHRGNVLPDAFLVPYDANVSDLATEIHSDLAKTMLYAVDARTRLRLPNDYVVKDRDVIKIVATARPKSKAAVPRPS